MAAPLVLVIGSPSALHAAIARRLAEDGLAIETIEAAGAVADALAGRPATARPAAAVFVQAAPGGAPAEDTSAEALLAALDETLADAGLAARALVHDGGEARPLRLVFVCDWAATGPPGSAAAAAAGGGMLGLARSWALEFAPLGVTCNAVIVGEGAASDDDADRPAAGPLSAPPGPEHVAHAVAFFLDARAGAISGQVLSVCGGRTAGSQPV